MSLYRGVSDLPDLHPKCELVRPPGDVRPVCYLRRIKMARRVHKQLDLPTPPTWGGKRKGAGRPPKGTRAGVPHASRPPHAARHPLHVTLRASRRDLPSLREHRVAAAIGLVLKRHGAAATATTAGPHAPGARGAALARRLRTASRLRVVHFSIEPDHVHLLVEAVDAVALGRGLQGLASQLARRVNAALGRCGQVFADRYHAHALRAPREVRNALVYVLQNHRKHVTPARGLESPFPAWVDPLSSAAWFDGWLGQPGRFRTDAPPVVPARPWLAAAAWRLHGLVHPAERPRVGR